MSTNKQNTPCGFGCPAYALREEYGCVIPIAVRRFWRVDIVNEHNGAGWKVHPWIKDSSDFEEPTPDGKTIAVNIPEYKKQLACYLAGIAYAEYSANELNNPKKKGN